MRKELLFRAYIVAGFIGLVAIVVFGKTVKIAIQEGDRWRTQGDSLYVRFKELNAPRGNILSANGALLATSQPFFEVRFDTKASGVTSKLFNENVDSLAWLISKNIQTDKSPSQVAASLKAAREKGNRYLLIGKNIDFPLYEKMVLWPIFKKGKHGGGFIAFRSEIRRRPYGMLAQRTIGYVRKGGVSVGLEIKFDSTLRGESVNIPMVRLPGNHYVPVENIRDASLKSGNDIQTTLDETTQDMVHQELLKALKKHEADYGVGIIIETKTGAIKAISNLGLTKRGSIVEDYNYAVARLVEPGSTFKLASALAVLDANKAQLTDSFNLNKGKKKIFTETLRDASAHDIERATFQKAFEISSNVGMAEIVMHSFKNNLEGRKAYIDKLRQFRLDRSTGIEISGENSPKIKDPIYQTQSKWSGITLPWMSMGYELQITPLQMASFYNAVANNGKYMKPFLVQNIQREGEVVDRISPVQIGDQIASLAAIKDAQKLLEGVVLNGTAKKHRSRLYNYAGKTGTVQYDYSPKALRVSGMKYQSSFIGYFPAEDPKYTMMILISNPRKGGFYGSEVALPVWKNIADQLFSVDASLHKPQYANVTSKDWNPINLPRSAKGSYEDIAQIFENLNIPVFDRSSGEFVKMNKPNDTLVVKPIKLTGGVVPDVRGMGPRDGLFILERLGCRVKLKGKGLIKTQSIAPGTKLRGQTIRLTLG